MVHFGMPVRTPSRRPSAKPSPSRRWLCESYAPEKSPLKVDREAGIIYGVRVLGRYSKNTHGENGLEGTEYSPECMKKAVELYEGVKVKFNHPADRRNPAQTRDVRDTLGVLRNARFDGECIRADLHFDRSHENAMSVCEDVERAFGRFGLSHNARASREKIVGKRLIIEEIELVRSVDLVDEPATNRNLWESQAVPITLRNLIEGRFEKFSTKRQAWATNLLEDDAPPMADAMDAPADVAPETEPDDDDAMTTAFHSSIMALVKKALAGELDLKEALSKIKELMTTHDKLTAEDEPVDVPEGEEEENKDEDKDVKEGEEEDKKKDDKDKVESLQARLDSFERREKARNLCESVNVTPSAELLEALCAPGLSDKTRKALVEQFKGLGRGRGQGYPRSVPTGRNIAESKQADKPATVEDELALLRS